METYYMRLSILPYSILYHSHHSMFHYDASKLSLQLQPLFYSHISNFPALVNLRRRVLFGCQTDSNSNKFRETLHSTRNHSPVWTCHSRSRSSPPLPWLRSAGTLSGGSPQSASCRPRWRWPCCSSGRRRTTRTASSLWLRHSLSRGPYPSRWSSGALSPSVWSAGSSMSPTSPDEQK